MESEAQQFKELENSSSVSKMILAEPHREDKKIAEYKEAIA